MKIKDSWITGIVLFVLCVAVWVLFIFSPPSIQEPVEETLKVEPEIIDLTAEAVRIYGLPYGREMLILEPLQGYMNDGIIHIKAFDAKTGLNKIYCIKDNEWLYFVVFLKLEGKEKEHKFEF